MRFLCGEIGVASVLIVLARGRGGNTPGRTVRHGAQRLPDGLRTAGGCVGAPRGVLRRLFHDRHGGCEVQLATVRPCLRLFRMDFKLFPRTPIPSRGAGAEEALDVLERTDFRVRLHH